MLNHGLPIAGEVAGAYLNGIKLPKMGKPLWGARRMGNGRIAH
jgi:hypothetical protein